MSPRYVTARHLRELTQRLTPTDWAIIEQVASLRFVGGWQLTRLCFDGADPLADARAARRVLLRLTRLGVLERLPRVIGGVRSGSAGFVYRLGPGGYRLAVLRGWLPERTRRRSQVPGLLFLDHTLQVAELHAQLVEGERSGSFQLLALAAEPACHRLYGGLGGQTLWLKPDSYVRLGLGPYEDSYFIEIDRGTEGGQAIARQLNAYVAYCRSGIEQAAHGVFPKVLWLAPSAERVSAIEGCVERLPNAERELFEVAEFGSAIGVMA